MAEIDLDVVKNKVEKMESINQLEILKIFVKHQIHINENKTGIRFNLGYLYDKHRHAFDEMMKYIEYIDQQESILNQMENEKKEISSAFFNNVVD